MNKAQAKRIAVDLFGPLARVTTRGDYTTVYTFDGHTKTVYGEGETPADALLDCFEDPVYTCAEKPEGWVEEFSVLVPPETDSSKNGA